MESTRSSVGAMPLEARSRPDIPKEIACAKCATCTFARTGDFCFFSEGTCLRGIVDKIAKRQQQSYLNNWRKNTLNTCKIIALCNQKGGVGKTTTTVNLGIGLAHEGKRVLLVNAYPQGDLTTCLGWTDGDNLRQRKMML